MDTRTKRFVAVAAYTEWRPAESISPAITGWTIRKRTHPIDGHPMALAHGPVTYPAYHDPAIRLPVLDLAARLCLTAVPPLVRG